MSTHPALGVMFRRENIPESLPGFAQRVETLGLDELWVVEDCFYAGGISSLAVALASTEHLRVGLGITPAVTRNAAFFAMEFATLARFFPGRLIAGLGHGLSDWMRQIGAFPPSQLAALEEVTEAVRSLMRGEEVTREGRYIHLDAVQLTHPPGVVPPVYLGVRGPKSLAVAGRVADGILLCETSSPGYIRWARAEAERARVAAGNHTPLGVSLYAFCSVDDDGKLARDRVRPMLAEFAASPDGAVQIAAMGIAEEVAQTVARGGIALLRHSMPDAWLDDLAIAGTPDQCIAAVRRFYEAGAESVILVPLLDQPIEPVLEFAGELVRSWSRSQ